MANSTSVEIVRLPIKGYDFNGYVLVELPHLERKVFDYTEDHEKHKLAYVVVEGIEKDAVDMGKKGYDRIVHPSWFARPLSGPSSKAKVLKKCLVYYAKRGHYEIVSE